MLPDFIMDKQSPDKKLFVAGSSDVTLTLNNREVFTTGGTTPLTIVRMPNVSEAEHRKFVIYHYAAGAGTGAHLHIVYNNGGVAALSTNINTVGVDVEFESNGLFWTLTRAV